MKKGLVLTTILALVAVLAAGCTELAPVTPTPTQPSGPSLSTGTIRVLVTDAPSYEVVNVAIHFLKVEVHKATDESGGDEGWIPIPLDFSDGQTFDETMKIDLNADMGNVILAEGQIEAGKYTQIRVYMDEEKGVEVTYKEGDSDPVPVEAKLPSGKLRFVRPFEVVENGETELLLDFDLQKSVVFTGASQSDEVKVIVKPVVKLLIEHEEPLGTIAGTVTDSGTDDSIEGATVEVDVDGTILSATTDEDGDYKIDDVPVGGPYTVTASAEGYQDADQDVSVIADTTTSNVDFVLEPSP